MPPRRPLVLTTLVVSIITIGFVLGSWSTQRALARQLAESNARVEALHDEMARSILQFRRAQTSRPLATDGLFAEAGVEVGSNSRTALVEEVKRQLQSEMGLLPVRVLRQRRDSFVELNAYDDRGSSSYSTAGYLGDGYFITVKHGVVPIGEDAKRRITSIKVRYHGKELPARVVDTGSADEEVHPGDWAIIRVRGELDLPP